MPHPYMVWDFAPNTIYDDQGHSTQVIGARFDHHGLYVRWQTHWVEAHPAVQTPERLGAWLWEHDLKHAPEWDIIRTAAQRLRQAYDEQQHQLLHIKAWVDAVDALLSPGAWLPPADFTLTRDGREIERQRRPVDVPGGTRSRLRVPTPNVASPLWGGTSAYGYFGLGPSWWPPLAGWGKETTLRATELVRAATAHRVRRIRIG